MQLKLFRGVQFKGDVEYIEVDSGYNDEDDDESLDSASVLESNLMKRRSTVCQVRPKML